jgi:hypothetical protein
VACPKQRPIGPLLVVAKVGPWHRRQGPGMFRRYLGIAPNPCLPPSSCISTLQPPTDGPCRSCGAELRFPLFVRRIRTIRLKRQRLVGVQQTRSTQLYPLRLLLRIHAGDFDKLVHGVATPGVDKARKTGADKLGWRATQTPLPPPRSLSWQPSNHGPHANWTWTGAYPQ